MPAHAAVGGSAGAASNIQSVAEAGQYTTEPAGVFMMDNCGSLEGRACKETQQQDNNAANDSPNFMAANLQLQLRKGKRFQAAGVAGMLLLSPYIAVAMIAMGLASFALDLALPGCWSTCMDVGGRYAGTLSGSMNMAGNIAGGVAPVAVGYILKYSGHNWVITFWISAVIYVIGGLCWWWIDPVTPLENEA